MEEPKVYNVEERRMWMSLLLEYLKEERLPNDPAKAKKLVKEAAKYIVIVEQLYKWGFFFPLLWCIEDMESYHLGRNQRAIPTNHPIQASQKRGQAESESRPIPRSPGNSVNKGVRNESMNDKETRAKVRPPAVQVIRAVDSNKLTLTWEGPFRMSDEVGKGAYCLEHLDGKEIPRTWNALNL
ncbi:hypothetical protein CR513_31409, partial [Mucuna pruriens]